LKISGGFLFWIRKQPQLSCCVFRLVCQILGRRTGARIRVCRFVSCHL
jgi:hypothetical protein